MAQKTDTATKAKKPQSKKTAPKKPMVKKSSTQKTVATKKPTVKKTSTAKPVAAMSAVKSKKHRKGFVAAVIFAILLVLGLIGVATYYCWYNNPEKVAYDALGNLIKADNIALEGGIVLHPRDKNSVVQDVFIEFNSASNSLPNATSVKVTVLLRPDQTGSDQNSGKISITVNNVILKDGAIYLQISGIMDSIESFGLDDDTREEFEFYLDTLEIIDGEWWRIYLPEIIDEMDLQYSQYNVITEMYGCMFEAANHSYQDEALAAYRQNRFINIERTKYLEPEASAAHAELASGHHAYHLSLDKVKLAGYLNQMIESDAAGEFFACYNQAVREYGGATIDASDFDEISADDITLPEDIYIGLEISDFGHRLRSVTIQQTAESDASLQFSGALLVKYVDANVEVPSEYRPISDLVEEIVELITSLVEEE